MGKLLSERWHQRRRQTAQTHAIAQHPSLPLDGAVRHSDWSGKCESLTMPRNAERGLWGLPGCITVPICLGGVFTWLRGSRSSGMWLHIAGQRYLSTSVTCWTHRTKQSASFMVFRSQILVCHILPSYNKVRTRSDQNTRLSSSYCIMPFFVNVYNAQCHVTQYVGGKLSHPACALIVCDVDVQTGSQGFLQVVWKQGWSRVRNNWLHLTLKRLCVTVCCN